METLLGCQEVIKKDGSTVDVASFSGPGKVVGLYFSAHWCPPCRGFTPKLAEYYTQAKAGPGGDNFEIIFISFDRDENSFNEYFGTMPWLSLDFDSEKKQELGEEFGVSGIPSLIFVSGTDGSVKTKDGRAIVANDDPIQKVIDM